MEVAEGEGVALHCNKHWKSLELKAVQIELTKNGKVMAIFDGYSSSDVLYSF